MQKVYEIWGWQNAERTLPCVFTVTCRDRAQRIVNDLNARGLFNRLEIKQVEQATPEQRANAMRVLFGKP